jgi:LPXTG-site transpeptidase (sortase) family protein
VNDSASYTASAVLVVDPAISKSANPTQASVGDTVTFTLVVTNQGNAPAPNVVVTDVLPSIFDVTAVNVTGAPIGTLVSVTPPIGTGPAPYTVVVTLGGNLNVTDVVTIQIVTRVNALGNPPINNTARLTTSALTDIVSNNAAAAAVTIRGAGNTSSNSQLPATGFAPNVITDLTNVSHETYVATGDLTVEIPSLGIRIPIVGVPKKDGTWNVAWLGNQAGWLQGTAFPSWSGNSVLTGHVYMASGLPGPFVDLGKLKYGDRIIVHAYGQKYIFEVRTNAVVESTDQSAFKHEEKSWITLITCKEYDEKTNTYRKRVVVRAVLVSVTDE